ncbi:VOC family protein [Nonomuraea sp. CA-218870]|uniref:VOC family protein n=1 Tax=Nonomuraea sp. CA-218870 TaxID=3239998 RepID=UPI003D913016
MSEQGLVLSGSAPGRPAARAVPGARASTSPSTTWTPTTTGARAADAKIIMELVEQPYGFREYAAEDPQGNTWHFGTCRP